MLMPSSARGMHMFEWWHWMVLGLVLAMAELAIPSFFIVWFGIGAVAVGLILLVAPDLNLTAQLLTWAALSTALTFFWFRYFKPKTLTAIGTSASHVIGEVGVLVDDLSPDSRGYVRFQKPVLGSDLWECYAQTELKAGARVRIVNIEGNFVKVEASQ